MKTIGFLVAIAAIIAILMAPDEQGDELATAQTWHLFDHVFGEESNSKIAADNEAIFVLTA